MVVMMGIGLFLRESGSKNLKAFFLGGRNMTWWLAGISLVATTFAADTPLAVTELVNKNGVAGNWLWWNFLAGGMLTTFFFSKLWWKANILTDLELVELRYTGKPAAFLRGFKAIYLGIFMNALVIGWVNVALISILQVFFNIPASESLIYVALAMLITAIYTSVSGLLGVAVTDFVQFIIAMGGTTVLAFYVMDSPEIGGVQGLKEKLPAWSLSFFPEVKFGASDTPVQDFAGAFTISIGAFFAYISMQWWSSWYPGADPGGGGYVAQRMMSTKNEQHAIAATLFFQIAHYCLRPWPWILVGLAVIVLYPDLPLEDKKLGYVMAMRDYLPSGIRGLLVTAFLAAYMSTISSQLNWGASYIVNDFYKRFINPEANQKRLIWVARVATLMVMVVALIITPMITSIESVWRFMIECGAGLGLVLILRWFWWRINVWSEITATLVPFIGYGVSKFILGWEFPNTFFLTVGLTTVSWLVVTFLTKPVAMEVLIAFYKRVTPNGYWEPVRDAADLPPPETNTWTLVLCWISSVTMIYGFLFLIGYVIFSEWNKAFLMMSVVSGSFVILAYNARKIRIFEKD